MDGKLLPPPCGPFYPFAGLIIQGRRAQQWLHDAVGKGFDEQASSRWDMHFLTSFLPPTQRQQRTDIVEVHFPWGGRGKPSHVPSTGHLANDRGFCRRAAWTDVQKEVKMAKVENLLTYT